MRRLFFLNPGRISTLTGLCLLGACSGVDVGGDGLSSNLPPAKAQVCREAVADALLNEGIAPQAVKSVAYQAVEEGGSRSSGRLRGFQAWVYPQSGGAWLVELSNVCQVRDVRMLRRPSPP